MMPASESGLLKVGTVPGDGTRIDAHAAKVKSIRYDRIQALRAKLANDVAGLVAQAGATDTASEDAGLSLPEEFPGVRC